MDASIHDHDHDKSTSTNITVTGYPTSQQPIGYPYNYSQPYVAAPCYPDSYYGGPQQYQYSPFQLDDHHNVDVDKLQRCVLLVTIAIIFSTSAMAFATWLLFGNEIPIFSVESLFVPVFNATNSSLSAKFVVNTTITNDSNRLEFHLMGSRSKLQYKDITIAKGEMDWDGISIDVKEEGNYITELRRNETDTSEMAGSDVLSSLYDDRKKGMVTFVLKTLVEASFRRDTMSSRITYFTIICEDLNVAFNNSDGTGNLVTNLENGQPKECLIFT